MKLLLCKECQDIVRMFQGETRVCKCGKVGGRYTDGLNAVYFGETAVPIGFSNFSLASAVNNQPKDGMGENFTAFVIPKICPTFTLELKTGPSNDTRQVLSTECNSQIGKPIESGGKKESGEVCIYTVVPFFNTPNGDISEILDSYMKSFKDRESAYEYAEDLGFKYIISHSTLNK